MNRLLRFRVGRLGTNAMLGTVGLVARAGLQAVYLIALTRVLGAAGYGKFAGSVAVATIAAALAGWGIAQVLFERVSKDRPSASTLWARALAQTAVTGGALAALVVSALAAFGTAIDTPTLALLCVSELVFVPLSATANLTLLAQERAGRAAMVAASIPLMRLVALALALLVAAPVTLEGIAVAHFAGSLFGVIVSVAVVRASGTRVARAAAPPALILHDGTRYALGALAAAAYTEIDKVLALELAGAESAGHYTAAFRIVAVLALPVWGLLNAAVPRLFAAPDETARRRLLVPLVGAALAYSVGAGVVCALGAGTIVQIFGNQFAHSGDSLAVLAIWLPLFALRQCGAFALTTSGRQSLRVGIELGGLALLVACDIALLPRLGGVGAAWALLITEAVLVIACWASVFVRRPS